MWARGRPTRAAHAIALLLWAASGPQAFAALTDELPALAGTADVCPVTRGNCFPREFAKRLLRPASGGGLTLPKDAVVRLHLHPSAGETLELAFRTPGTALHVTVTPEDGEPVAVLEESRADEAPQQAVVPLGAWAGRTIRLDLLAASEPGAPGGDPSLTRLGLAREQPPQAAPALPRSRSPKHVVVYLIDTLRADHLGCYGYPRNTTPSIDAFAATAVRFDDAVAQSSWTLPSTASVLTGRTPPHHGASAVGRSLRTDVPTLAQLLGARGFTTAAFVTNYLVSEAFGLSRGFETFRFYPEEAARRATVYLPSTTVVRRVARWLDQRDPERPFFLYVHAADPHWPYRPPPRALRRLGSGAEAGVVAAMAGRSRPWFFGNDRQGERPVSLPAADVATLRDLYDGDVSVADEAFGQLLDALAARNLLDDTMIVLTSDHGEEFLDHDGLGHGQTLHEEVLRVPLLVRLPGNAAGGTRVAEVATHVDIVPTVLHAVGVPPPDGLDGRSLLAPTPAADEVEAYAHLDHLGTLVDALTTSRWRAIRDRSSATPGLAPIALYDRVHDRVERRNLAPARPVLSGYARQQLRTALADSRTGRPVDPTLLERLVSLGYVDR